MSKRTFKITVEVRKSKTFSVRAETLEEATERVDKQAARYANAVLKDGTVSAVEAEVFDPKTEEITEFFGIGDYK